MQPAELNYEIYDKELLAFLSFSTVAQLPGGFSTCGTQCYPITKNLKYFTTTKQSPITKCVVGVPVRVQLPDMLLGREACTKPMMTHSRESIPRVDVHIAYQ